MNAADESAPPVARVDETPRWSPVWIVPVAAALLAAALAWQAWGERGVPIDVVFDSGHGLAPGDTVRRLGIVVGEVQSVRLGRPGEGVVAKLQLEPEAANVARVGSRFWIVRPELGLEGVAGLDTLTGARYVAVLPGSGGPQRNFVGLDEAPIPEALQPGLDIVLESRDRAGLLPGSPVTYRKIRVGAVLGVGLASDARTVEAHVRIAEPYVHLVRPGTRFWSTGGLGLDVGLTGVQLHLDTLEALLRGGVSLATPPGEGEPVPTGQRFELAGAPEDAWLKWAPPLPVGHSLLPPGATLPHPLRAALTWTEGRFWTGEERREGWVLPVGDALLGPADLMVPDESAHEASAALEVGGLRLPIESEPRFPAPGLGLLPLGDQTLDETPWPRDRQRHPQGPESCLVVAEPGEDPLSLAAGRFTVEDDGWALDPAIPVERRMHGACVLARSDGSLIGLLLVDGDDGARVVPLPHPVP